jgi:effector-binding domain-containing protein
MRIDNAIQRKIHFMEQKLANLKLEALETRWYPERRYIPIGSEDHLYMEDSFYFYPTIAFYEENLKYFGAYLEVSADGLNTDVIRSGSYLVGYHKGPYELVEQRIAQIRDARPDLSLGRCVINFNIIDQFVERDSENYITEIQIPIEDT